jgi:glutathione S-transferase
MMQPFDLFGTKTSPFVRRVRVVALERNIPFRLVDVNEPQNQARLRSLTPVWKVPTAVFEGGLVVWDSRVIVEHLTRDGWGPLRAPPSDTRGGIEEDNVVNAIDEGLLALVRLFYVRKDGLPTDAPWHKKERARVEAILDWTAGRVRDGRFVGPYGGGHGFGRSELALVTALQWMRFRGMMDIDRWQKLADFERGWGERRSLAETRPG